MTNELYDPAKGRWHLFPDYSVITIWDEGFDHAVMQGEFCVCNEGGAEMRMIKLAVGWHFVFF